MESAAPNSEILQPLGHFILNADLLVKARQRSDPLRSRPFAFKPRGNTIIGELCPVTNNSPVEIPLGNGRLLIDDTLDDHCQTLFALTKRCKIGGERLGQHGEDLCSGVNRRCIVLGVAVDGRFFLYNSVNIGDRNQYLHRSTLQRFRHCKLIQVFRVVVVDRGPKQTPQIANFTIVFNSTGFDSPNFSLHCIREIRQQAAVDHRPASNRLEVCSMSSIVTIHLCPSPLWDKMNYYREHKIV